MTAAPELLSPPEAVYRAAVEITDDGGEHAGIGLALALPDRGPVILSCHHVVAPIAPGKVRARFRDGSVHEATLDAGATRVERDAAVLTVADPPAIENPRLHAPRPEAFVGALDGTAYSPGGGVGNFAVRLTGNDQDRVINVPYEPRRYVLPNVFIINTDDSRPGVSGSPVLSESGVVGLVHAARDERRVAFVGPIHAWREGLPELERLIEPFVTQAIRGHAAVFWGARALERPELHVPGRPAPYIDRAEDDAARRAFEGGALYLVGRHNSGKSRLVHKLLRDSPEAIVVVPDRVEPPESLAQESDLLDRPVILVFDNVHAAVSAWRPLQWFDRFRRANPRTTLILTASNEDDWGRVQEQQRNLFEAHGAEPVYLSEREGRDLDQEAGWRLAQEIGMDRETFEQRFDGTPGSLLVDEDAPPPPGEALPGGRQAGISITTVSMEHVRTNLPAISSTFVGRELELGALDAMLERGALVSLTGPPGVGKTRLALHFGSTRAASFPDGVWCVDLSQTRDERQVLDIVARSVGAGRRVLAQVEDALVERLRGQRALVILNGPEDVHAAAARLAAKLTEGNPPLRVLVAVETPLGAAGEDVLTLDSLSATDAAERLFLDRSGLAAPDDQTRVKPFYEALGGNAAALEIAAAQVRTTGLERASDARERRPAVAAGDVLRLAVLSSLEDVPEAEAAVFRRLGAMPDWFTLKAARAVTAGGEVAEADVPDHLRALVDRALLLIDSRDEAAQRFRMLPSVSELATEQLETSGELGAVGGRHAAYYTRLAEEANKRLQGRSSRSWLAKLEADQQHLRAALHWGIDNDRFTALRLCSALWMPCIARSNFTEGRRWIDEMTEAVLPALDELSPDEVYWLADALIGGAYLAYHQGDYADAERQLTEARSVRERPGGGTGHGDDENLRGLIARRRCEFEEARRLVKAAAAISKAEGDMPRLADRLNTIGNVLREGCGDLAKADRRQQQSLGIYARLGDLRGAAMVQCDRAYVLLDGGDHATARRLFEESLETRGRMRDKQGEAQSLNGIGILEREEHRPQAAIERHEQALEIFDRIGDALRCAETRESLGLALVEAGSAAEGRAHLDRAQEVRDAIGAPRPPVLRNAVERTFAETRTGRFAQGVPVSVPADPDLPERG